MKTVIAMTAQSLNACHDDITTGGETYCSNPKCNNKMPLCGDCASRLLNKKDICSYCTNEEELRCDGCQDIFTESRLTHCAGDGCLNTYCANCKKDHIIRRGLCNDCL